MNTVLNRLKLWTRLGYNEITYWLVGVLPESYHAKSAHLWMELGNWNRSIKHCIRALSLVDYDYVKAILGYSYAMKGEWEKSAEAYESIGNIYGEPSFALGLAESQMQLGNIDRAREIIAVVGVNSDRTSLHIASSLEFLRGRLAADEHRAKDA